MLKPIENWDDVPTYDSSEKLKLGGRMCVIKNVKLFTREGIEKVSLELDITEEENKDFFQKKYDSRSENAKFWDSGATLVFLAEPKEKKDQSYVKGLMTAIESYNEGYHWNWDEQSLKGKRIGVNFSLVEYQGNDGKIYTKPQVNRWVNEKDNFKIDFIPEVRTINNTYIDYEEYQEIKKNGTKDATNINKNDVVLDENLLD